MHEHGALSRLLTHRATADYLRISESQLFALNARRAGPRSYKVGRLRRYRPEDVQAWLDQHASDHGGSAA
jgi:predicted DNA-binding transcriptional regulator AlpA